MSAATCTKAIYGRQRCRALLQLGTDGNGKATAVCPKCDRTRRGICRDCPGRVSGRALWCESCRIARRRQSEKRWRSDPDNRRRRNKRWTVRRRARVAAEPEFAARIRDRRRSWRKENPDKVKRSRRRYLLKRTPGYVANYQRHNANPVRAQKKRDQALRRYYELHPLRPDGRCKGCGGATGWQPMPGGRSGAPPKWGYCCAPMPECMRRIRRGFASWQQWRSERSVAA